MGELSDYLDALSPSRSRAGFGAFGANPVGGAHDSLESAMWTYDTRWAPARGTLGVSSGQPSMPSSAIHPSPSGKAMWESYVKCVRVAEVGGGWLVQPWSTTGAALCTSVFGDRQAPRCRWGVWRMPVCSSESIALAWQGQRYLWAQQKMRELLLQPVTRANAAQWVWSAFQLVSLLHWSTNIRFNNPQERVLNYSRELERAGCLFPGIGNGETDGAPAPGQIVPRLGGFGVPITLADWNRQSAVVSTARGPGVVPPLVPIARADFSPWFDLGIDPLRLVKSSASPAVLAVIAQTTARLGSSTNPWAMSRSLVGTDPEAPMPTFITWMEQTWGQATVPTQVLNTRGIAQNVPLIGAQGILETTRRVLEHYVRVPFLLWQTTILTVYQTEMQPFVARLPGASQLAFNRSIADFAGRAQAAQAAQWNSGEAGAYTVMAMTLIAGLVSSGAGALLGAMFTLIGYLVTFLGDAGVMATGSSICPAFPFIRVPDPPCDALGPPVDAIGLPMTVPASGPVMLSRTQVQALRTLQAAGTPLTPSQAALVASSIRILVPPSSGEGSTASSSGLLLGVGAVALLAMLARKR